MDCVEGNTVNGDLPSGFLHPSGAHNPRIMQLGMKFLF
jgi:hypothetical protein